MIPSVVFIAVLLILLIVVAFITRRQQMIVRLPARVESARLLMSLAADAAQRAHLGADAAFQTRLAMDEACMNIIEHAYLEDETGEIEVFIRTRPGELRIHLTDFGEAYNPADVSSEPLFGTTVETAKPGGLGLYLMRRAMDEVRYHSTPRGNTLVMVKRR